MKEYRDVMEQDIALINQQLRQYLAPEAFRKRESRGLDRMLDAMGYSLHNGGKRIRPVLALEFCALCGGKKEQALAPACAIEMIHTYSLIHDDLPCMDNDDMRRGKPSNHVQFGYADALLAGDGLLTLAFEVLLEDTLLNAEKKAKIGALLARGAGASGMIAGQVMDLQNEGKNASLAEICATDAKKTGELIRAAGLMGCLAAGADKRMFQSANEYCDFIGLAFQIIDDILDVTSSAEVLGKPIGSDEQNKKSTYVSLLGIEEARDYAKRLTEQAKAAVWQYKDSGFLVWFADYLAARIK